VYKGLGHPAKHTLSILVLKIPVS